MDNKINISFVISIAIAVMFLIGVPLLGPVKVHAETFEPYKNPGPLFFSGHPDPFETSGSTHYEINGGKYGFYEVFHQEVGLSQRAVYYLYSFNIDSCFMDSTSFTTPNIDDHFYYYNYNGVNYRINYKYCYCLCDSVPSLNIGYNANASGTQVFKNFPSNTDIDIQAIINYFLFGVGDLDYQLPAEDIPDSDLDIHGLDCVVLNDQQASIQVGQTMKSSWDRFVSAIYSLIFDTPKDYISKATDPSNTGFQYIKNYVPGVSLLWDSPPVVMQSEALTVENPVQYTIWIDGKTDIKYNSASDIIKNFFSGTSVGSCAYSKLQIHDGMIVSTPYHTYYYNTNQGLDTILDYIANNTQFTRPTETDDYQNICATTTISRIYIQAHQIDPETGDNRYGAITYVDLSNGIPTVYEGVTEDSIDDIPASDPDDGATTDTSQPFTVSGNDLVYDDPVHKENVCEPGGGGLIVPPSGFLSAGLALIQAILELVKMWFLLKLVPILTLGFTGHI